MLKKLFQICKKNILELQYCSIDFFFFFQDKFDEFITADLLYLAAVPYALRLALNNHKIFNHEIDRKNEFNFKSLIITISLFGPKYKI